MVLLDGALRISCSERKRASEVCLVFFVNNEKCSIFAGRGTSLLSIGLLNTRRITGHEYAGSVLHFGKCFYKDVSSLIPKVALRSSAAASPQASS